MSKSKDIKALKEIKPLLDDIEMRHDFALVLSNAVRMDQVWAICEDL